MSFNIENFSESVETFLCANTPNYLYTHFVESQEIRNLSDKLSPEAIYDLCVQLLKKDEANHKDELSFYIYLVALSFQPYPKSHDYLKSLTTNKYKWANDIILLIINRYKLVTEYFFEKNLDEERADVVPPEKREISTSVHKINL